MKKCTKCNKSKSEKDFYKDKSKTGGLRPDCKQCNNKTSFAYRTNNKDKVNKYAKNTEMTIKTKLISIMPNIN